MTMKVQNSTGKVLKWWAGVFDYECFIMVQIRPQRAERNQIDTTDSFVTVRDDKDEI